jgi:RecA-family ATPase
MTVIAGQFIQQANGIKVVDAGDWIDTEPPELDQVIVDMLDAGDKMAVLASPKQRKSWFVLQLSVALAAGGHSRFLNWDLNRPRRVLYVQFEIREHHCHRRMRRICWAMGIRKSDLNGRLKIISARGLGLSGADGLEQIRHAVEAFKPEVIVLDPIYKLVEGAENAAEDLKELLAAFDQLAEKTGAALIYVHHDCKGNPGDRDIRDRGAGSNVLSRDYDVCVTLTPHSTAKGVTVVETLLRNYEDQDPFSMSWQYSENGGGCFILADGVAPDKKTSSCKRTPPPIESYLPIAKSIISNGEMAIGVFKALLKEKSGLSDNRMRDFMSWATESNPPRLLTRSERGRGKNNKWVCLP